MSTRRISSGSQEYPMPKDVVRGVLARLIEGADSSTWAHFEVIPEGGWFRNLLSGKGPWVEVAYVDEHSLQLNCGVCKKWRVLMVDGPESWKFSGVGLWSVPISESDALIDWIEAGLAAVSGRPQYHVSGWIEG
jgi:hypothetical protein